MSVRSQRLSRTALALVSLLFGWALGYAYFMLAMVYFSDYHRVTDGEAIAVWTAVFVTLGWLVFAVPVAVWADPRKRIFSLSVCPFFGAAYSLAAFLVLIGWVGSAEPGSCCMKSRRPGDGPEVTSETSRQRSRLRSEIPAPVRRVFNVGDEPALSERKWVERIGAASGWRGRVVAVSASELPNHLKQPFDWRYELWTDTSSIREELGYVELIPLDEALQRTVEWERSTLDG